MVLQSIGNSLPAKTYQTENNKIQAAHIKKEVRAVYQFVDKHYMSDCSKHKAILLVNKNHYEVNRYWVDTASRFRNEI